MSLKTTVQQTFDDYSCIINDFDILIASHLLFSSFQLLSKGTNFFGSLKARSISSEFHLKISTIRFRKTAGTVVDNKNFIVSLDHPANDHIFRETKVYFKIETICSSNLEN